jgi:hypothetical protein
MLLLLLLLTQHGYRLNSPGYQLPFHIMAAALTHVPQMRWT